MVRVKLTFGKLTNWFRKELELVHLKRNWRDKSIVVIEPDQIVYTDASTYASGGLVIDPRTQKQVGDDVYFVYDNDNNPAPIHCKEIWVLRDTVVAKLPLLR